MTAAVTGLLCWRDSHPQERQLASLHLLLHRSGLAPPTPCRSPGALRVLHAQPTSLVSRSEFLPIAQTAPFRAILGVLYPVSIHGMQTFDAEVSAARPCWLRAAQK